MPNASSPSSKRLASADPIATTHHTTHSAQAHRSRSLSAEQKLCGGDANKTTMLWRRPCDGAVSPSLRHITPVLLPLLLLLQLNHPARGEKYDFEWATALPGEGEVAPDDDDAGFEPADGMGMELFWSKANLWKSGRGPLLSTGEAYTQVGADVTASADVVALAPGAGLKVVAVSATGSLRGPDWGLLAGGAMAEQVLLTLLCNEAEGAPVPAAARNATFGSAAAAAATSGRVARLAPLRVPVTSAGLQESYLALCACPVGGIWCTSSGDAPGEFLLFKRRCCPLPSRGSSTWLRDGSPLLPLYGSAPCPGNASQACPGRLNVRFVARVRLALRNPYGYLPSQLWCPYAGSALRAAAQWAALIAFLLLARRHRPELLPMHGAVGAVLLCGLVDSSAWALAYASLNASGAPPTCPRSVKSDCVTPAAVVASTILTALRQTVACTALLLISLGLSVWRPQLPRAHRWGVGALGAAHLAFGVAEKALWWQVVGSISGEGGEMGKADGGLVKAWRAVVVFAGLSTLVFAMWILTALVHSRDKLQASNETQKLAIYERLFRTLKWACLVFVGAFALENMFKVSWDWRLQGMWEVVWEAAMLAATAAIAYTLRPAANSSQYALSLQLQSEPDDNGEPAVRRQAGGPAEEEEEEEEEDGGDGGRRQQQGGGGGVEMVQIVERTELAQVSYA